MKAIYVMNIRSTLFTLIALTFAACLSSCEKEESGGEGSAPVLTVIPSIDVDFGEEVYSLAYSVQNPVSGGELQCSGNVIWLTDFSVDDSGNSSGTITFTVAKNSYKDDRSGNIYVTYYYYDGATRRYVTSQTSIVQHGKGDPRLYAETDSLSVSLYGGDYGFRCTVEYPDDKGVLTCSADEDWITELEVTQDGNVSFTVGPNETGYVRSSTITVTYTYGYEEIFAQVTATQENSTGDFSEILGTYEAYGFVYGEGYNDEYATWELKIYRYDGDKDYDIYVEGIVPWASGGYAIYGDYRTSALGYYQNGKIVIPTQCSTTVTIASSSGVYYLAYTPCTKYDGDYVYYNSSYSLTFAGGVFSGYWESDYGMCMAGCWSKGAIQSLSIIPQVVAPIIQLTRISPSTSSTTSPASTPVVSTSSPATLPIPISDSSAVAISER